MNFRGKAISGSSVLTILGIVCFATVLVAAAVLTSGFISFDSTTVNGSIPMEKTSTPGAVNVGANADYGFTATVPQSMTGTVLTIRIAESGGIATGDVTSITLVYDGGEAQVLTVNAASGGYISTTYSVSGTQLADTVPCTVTVVYAYAGSYTVSVQLEGTAA